MTLHFLKGNCVRLKITRESRFIAKFTQYATLSEALTHVSLFTKISKLIVT